MSMKRFNFLMVLAMTSSIAFAQTYRLTEMTKETFAAGGDEQWSFQKYEYGTGTYTSFSTYGDESTCNFLDYFLPERVMGERITEIDGYTQDTDGNYWAGNKRFAWYDRKYEAPKTDSNDKFIYMTENFETYANPKYAGVVSFTVPADGYYAVSGTIVRQDCFKLNPLHLVPRFRKQGIETVDSAVTMGFAFAYGDKCGELENFSNTGLPEGGQPRFKAQEPVDYSFAFYAKKGDVVSFETSAAKHFLYTTWVRDIYGRSFFKKLDIETIDKATAEAMENYVDPYNMDGVQEFLDKMGKYETEVGMIESNDELVGVGYGKYSQEAIYKFYEEVAVLYDAYLNGAINGMNVAIYDKKLEEIWNTFQNSKANFDYTVEGNYVLFTDDENIKYVQMPITSDTNNDQPFGYYYYDVKTGQYGKFSTFANTKGGKEGWCRSTGEWMYINYDGDCHPLNNMAPTIMFTAPADGYYKVGITVYRPNPNMKVINPLYIRARMVTEVESVLSCPKDEEMFSKQYGHVETDGMQGKAPVDLDFYVHLKEGDRIAADIDAYTSNRNSSAGTQFTRFVVARMLSEGNPITKEFVDNADFPCYDPYRLADMSALEALLVEARAVDEKTKTNTGEGEGQYAEEAYTAFAQLLAQAEAYVANPGDATQREIENFTNSFNKAIAALLASRKPFNVAVEGKTAIRVAGTEKVLIQKDPAPGAYYYGAIMTLDEMIADAEKNNRNVEDYRWSFTVNPHADGGYYLATSDGVLTSDGYVSALPPNPTDVLADSRIAFYKQEKTDSTVAICRMKDNQYWDTNMQWKSPYNKLALSGSPLYKWVLCEGPVYIPNAIELTDNVSRSEVKVEYFTLDGRKLAAPVKGIVVKRTVFGNGTVATKKIVVK